MNGDSRGNGTMEKIVKIYALSKCPHCNCTKKLLMKYGVRFEFTDVDKMPKESVAAIMEEIKTLTERYVFPTIIIGDKVIVGYCEQEIREALDL
jgi:glutaredoxin-like protein NrdH